MALINKIKLKNWKSHDNSTLEFTLGTNGIVGIVGSGKTSVLDGICFALFGTFPTLQARKIKLDDVIMKKPVKKDSAEVELEFTLGDNNYYVKRVIEKGKGTTRAEVRKDGKILESSSTTNVTAIVEKKLKMNYELFSKAIYSKQNSIDYFLRLGKGKRMKKIDELLMIDRFEDARSNAVTLKNKVADRKAGKQSVVDQIDIKKTEEAIKEMEESIEDVEEKRVRLGEELKKVRNSKDELEKDVEELKKMKNNLDSLRREDKGLESTIEATEEVVEDIEKALDDVSEDFDISSLQSVLEEQSKKIDDMKSFLDDKQEEYDKMQSGLASSKTNIEFLQNEKIGKLEREFNKKMEIMKEYKKLRDRTGENVNQQVDEKELALKKLIGEMEATRARISDLKEQLDEISSVEGICPLCNTSLSEERKKMIKAEKQEELERLKGRISEFKEKKSATEKEIGELESAARDLEEMMKEISDLDSVKSELEKSKKLLKDHKDTVDKIGGEVESLREEIKIVKEELEDARDDKQKLKIIAKRKDDYEDKKKRIRDLKEKREELRGRIKEIKEIFSVKKLEDAEKELRDLIAREKEIETVLSGSEEMIKERRLRLKEHKKNLEKAVKEKNEVERLEKLVKNLKIFTEALKQTQISLREEFVEAVNFTMNKLWTTLYPYQDFIGVRMAIEDRDYVLQLQERTTNWVDVEGAASGGERSIACLALRIAFALVLAPHLRLLVLDEPTANLDTNSVKVLANTLREDISEFIDQCFIITHDETFETAITGNAYRLERDKGKDEATKVVQIA